MAGSKIGYRLRVKASSILEVLIAMIIILLVFGIAMMISANVLRSSLSVNKIKAQALLHELLMKAEQTKENTTQTFTLNGFRLEQEINVTALNKNLMEIHLTAYDENQEKVGELQTLLINKND